MSMNMLNIQENTSSTLKKKKTQGRKKIEIKKIESLISRQVTFSKRRLGLFKKASELCILTGAHVAIIVHSLGMRVFSFGHPTEDSVIDRFLNGSAEHGNGGGEARDNFAVTAKTRDYNRYYREVCKELEAEKKRKEIQEAEKMAGGYGYGGGGGFWWDEPVELMELEELEQYVAALEELINNVTKRANELMFTQDSNCMPPPPPPPITTVGSIPNLGVKGCSLFGDTAGIVNQSASFDYSNWILPTNDDKENIDGR